jgi:hypothetical protein
MLFALGPRSLSMFVVLAAVMACAACSERIERGEADRIARAELERYASEQGYAIDRYSPPEVQENDEQPWLYSYRYLAPPRHELVVTIDRWGKAELSHGPEDRK